MFCPSCGTEDSHSSQFCRACGADLGRVRTAVSAPDALTASAASAREEIGRAVAAKVRDTHSADELAKVSHRVLPEIEKFLESPEEKRLRRMRSGMILSGIGFGVALALTIIGAISPNDKTEFLFMAGLGVVAFFLGIAFILNGYLFSVPNREAADNSAAADSQRELDASEYAKPELPPQTAQSFVSSVTEHTTKNLEKESGSA